MSTLHKICSKCNFEQPIRTNKCPSCGSTLTKSGKVRGRPAGTAVTAGYRVGPSLRKDTTIAAGYNASNGRPVGTTGAAGYSVRLSGGRTPGTTITAGYNVGVSGGCPEGTTLASGHAVGMSSGRPLGTTLAVGCSIGISGGRPEGRGVASIGLSRLEPPPPLSSHSGPSEWAHSVSQMMDIQ